MHFAIYVYTCMINEWTDGRMDGWTDGRMDGWTDGLAKWACSNSLKARESFQDFVKKDKK